MLESIRRGFGFLGQAIQMATKDPDLLKPSVYAFFAGIGVALLTAIPSFLIFTIFGEPGGDFFGVIAALALAIFAFLQYAVTYFFSGMTVKLVRDYLTDGDGRMDTAWETVRRDLLDILALAAVSAVVKFLESILRGNRRKRNPLGEMLGRLLSTVWTVATYFVLPAMILEDLNLAQALKRATYIIKNNLLLVAVTEIGVSSVVGLIGVALVLLTLALGAGLVYLAGSLGNWELMPLIFGGGAAVLLAGAVIAAVMVLSSYVTTAYHTCLFVWATQVEQARTRGQADTLHPAPAPVAAVI